MFSKSFQYLAASCIVGSILGISQYWTEISGADSSHQTLVVQDPQSNIEPALKAEAINEEISKKLPDLNRIARLDIPTPQDDAQTWELFLASLGSIDLKGKRGAWDYLSPIVSIHAYAAHYQPQIYYQKMSDGTLDSSLTTHLFKHGYLNNWYAEVENPEAWLMNQTSAVISLASSTGDKVARREVGKALIKLTSQNSKVNLNLVAYAYPGLTNQERDEIKDALLNGSLTYDPRSVASLTRLDWFSREELVSLIKKTAYPSRSMSSYMETALSLGDKSYLPPLLDDLKTNSKQPTNFYCSACYLAMHSEGLLGESLENAYISRSLIISEDYPFIMSRKDEKILEVGHGN